MSTGWSMVQVEDKNVFTGDFFYHAHRCLATEEKCLSVWTRMFMPAAGGQNLGFFAQMSAHIYMRCTVL